LKWKEVISVTTLVRWDPFRGIDLFERERGLLPSLIRIPPVPATDIYETEKEYVVEMEVPGYEEKELSVEVLDHVLTIKGTHEAESEQTEKSYRLQERLAQTFERRFELPPTVDTKKVKATFKDGVLELHARKAEVEVPKKIPVET